MQVIQWLNPKRIRQCDSQALMAEMTQGLQVIDNAPIHPFAECVGML